MRIATWNVNGLRARLDFVLHWLRARAPDVVGLQELKLTDDQFPHAALASAGYRAVCLGQKGWNGVAILARDDIELTRRGLPGQDEMGSRLITARVRDLTFTTIYVPNGKRLEHEDYRKKLAWLDDLAAYCAAPDEATVVCGDFNLCPSPLDSWNEELFGGTVHHTTAERDRYRRLLDLGLVDVFREHHPDTQAFSWWDYRGGAFHRRQGLRIDFLLATRAVANRVQSVEIDRDYRKKQEGLVASDHAPVIADLASSNSRP